jgi:hypothetical protein
MAVNLKIELIFVSAKQKSFSFDPNVLSVKLEIFSNYVHLLALDFSSYCQEIGTFFLIALKVFRTPKVAKFDISAAHCLAPNRY